MDGETPADRSGIQDISDEHQKDTMLRESEARYRQLVETTTDWIWETDREGNHTYSNHAGETFLGYKVSEIIGTNAFSHILPEEEHRLKELIAECIADKDPKPITTTIRWRHKDRSERFFESAIIPLLNSHGEITGFRGIDRDITERKQAEQALLSANRKLSMLNSITRHDINNQLMVLMAYLSLMEDCKNVTLNNDYCRIATTAAERIAAMIQFTKEYEQVGVQTPVWYDIMTLVDKAARKVAHGNIVIQNNLAPGVEVFSDPLIEKVIYNLIENAVRYGNTITIIRFSLIECEGGHLIICEDDGDGVVVDEKERIFQRGFGKNTGL
ncbi:MAG: PAS domain S-box protein, partial [Methanomicrobiales archaeon]|nr:PAS domain S-box protein [Methanomicrobiales archaeon]